VGQANLDGQVEQSDLRPGTGDKGMLDRVLQLPDVARPAEVQENAADVRRQVPDRLAGLAVEPVHEMSREEEDVGAALAQRRQMDREHIETVKEILAKSARFHQLPEIAVGGGDDPDIGVARFAFPEALEFMVLEEAQEFDLHQRAQIADLVEHQCAAMGQFEAAGLVLDRPGEGAPGVAEEFAFKQRFRQRGAVQFDQGPPGAGAPFVDFLGNEFFAGAGFAENEDGGVGLGGQADALAYRSQRGAVAD